MSIVIDTDIFVDFFRSYSPCKAWFIGIDWKEVYFSAITEAELLSGRDCNNEVKLVKTLQLISFGNKVYVDNDVARKAGEFRRKYGVELEDSLIAATAFVNNATLVTRNKKHFEIIKEIKIKVPYL